jgi:heptosyltransferase-2
LAKPSPNLTPPPQPHLLVLELWGIGDLALAVPFLRAAALHARVTLVGQPHAAPLLARFAPSVEFIPLVVPWTRFRGKYRLHRWPWRELWQATRALRQRRFDCGTSARPDPRDHLLLALGAVKRRVGFSRAGSGVLLQTSVPRPARPHRAAHWAALASVFGWECPPLQVRDPGRAGKHVVIHPGAAQSVRRWPRARFEVLADRLRSAGWRVTMLAEETTDLEQLLDTLASATRFIGNDSGPGHLAALLDVPTFTIFGPQLPELFAPTHPTAAWIEGAPCPHKPCFDRCRFAEPHCLLQNEVDAVWSRVAAWLPAPAAR